MHKVVVLTDAETATGYRLAGVEVRVSDAEGAHRTLDELIQSDAYGLIVVDEGLMADPLEEMERSMRGRELPVLLPVPSLGASFEEDGDVETYMKELVRNAIGFDVKLEG